MEKQQAMKEHMRLQIVYFKILIVVFSFAGCNQDTLYLHYAYKAAGENKAELKSVIKYYRKGGTINEMS